MGLQEYRVPQRQTGTDQISPEATNGLVFLRS